MQQYIRQTPEFLKLYNCSKINIDDVPLSLRQHTTESICYIVITFIAYVLYIPIIMSIYKLMNNACYKLLFYISLLNISCLFILGILHGILGMMGAVYCNYPNFIYIFGCFMSGLWLAESSAELILVVNRVLSILVPSLEKMLFSGRRIYLWICASILFANYWFWLKKPILFNAIYFTYVFNPYAGYIDDSADVYNNMLHTVWDITIAVGLPTLYIVFCIFYFIKAKVSVDNKKMNKKEKMMLLQVLIISLLNFFACSVYVHMMYVIPSEFLMHFAQFCWLLIHSLPTVIFLALNTSIRNNSKRIVNSFSEKYSKAIFKKETLVTSVTANQSTTN